MSCAHAGVAGRGTMHVHASNASPPPPPPGRTHAGASSRLRLPGALLRPELLLCDPGCARRCGWGSCVQWHAGLLPCCGLQTPVPGTAHHSLPMPAGRHAVQAFLWAPTTCPSCSWLAWWPCWSWRPPPRPTCPVREPSTDRRPCRGCCTSWHVFCWVRAMHGSRAAPLLMLTAADMLTGSSRSR